MVGNPERKAGPFNAMRLRSQRPLHVQGVAGHPGEQGGGQEKNYWKKWRAKEEERHKELLVGSENQSCSSPTQKLSLGL
jgi:hypothetical protein